MLDGGDGALNIINLISAAPRNSLHGGDGALNIINLISAAPRNSLPVSLPSSKSLRA